MKSRSVAANGPTNIESEFRLQVTCGKGSYGIGKEPHSARLPDKLLNVDDDLSGDYYKLVSVEWVREVFNPSYRKFCEDRGISYDMKDFIYGKRKSLTS
jgi:hypothetical protein|tara:strand:+ start:3465 stop:3761 length:297 start_codon:yes stop_codon:yes gene_type:complete